MRIVSVIAVSILVLGGAATASAADDEHPAPRKARAVHSPRPPAEATEPEKKDWVSQTVGDVLEGIGDLGKPLQDLQR
jgi:hypothetical protein